MALVPWIRRFWPIPALLAAVITVQAVWTSRYTVTGHAAEHLASASPVFGLAFLIGVVVWGVAAASRRTPGLWILVALVIAGAVGVAMGNVRVVDAIGGASWSTEEVELLGPTRPGFVDGHDLAERAALFTVAISILLALWLWRHHAVSGRVCAGAVVLTIIVPYWIFPGAGVVVLAVALVIAQLRSAQPPPAPRSP